MICSFSVMCLWVIYFYWAYLIQCMLFFNSQILRIYLFRYLFFVTLSFLFFMGILTQKILIPSYFMCLVHDFLQVLNVSYGFISLLEHLKHTYIEVSVRLPYDPIHAMWINFTFWLLTLLVVFLSIWFKCVLEFRLSEGGQEDFCLDFCSSSPFSLILPNDSFLAALARTTVQTRTHGIAGPHKLQWYVAYYPLNPQCSTWPWKLT